MAKKRGLAANRGLDALLGSIKKEKQITASALQDDMVSQNTVSKPATDSSINDNADIDKAKQTSAEQHLEQDSQDNLSNKQGKHNQSKHSQSKHSQAKKPNKHANNTQQSSATRHENAEDQISLVQIDVSRLQAGKYQPRRDMSEAALVELASSIEQHGVMQPIVIRPLLANEDKADAKVTHEIIAGERRWRAAKMAGKSLIPAIERTLSDELAIALALIENIQREDLTVIEQAAALQRFHTEFGMSHAMIADVVGKARTTVSNLLRLNQLHETVKDHLANSQLDMGHARTLLPLAQEQQPIIAQKIIDGGLTVREAEKLVKSILQPADKVVEKTTGNHEIERLNQQLSEVLGATVKLKQKKGGKGSVEIFFHSDEELAAIIEHLKT